MSFLQGYNQIAPMLVGRYELRSVIMHYTAENFAKALGHSNPEWKWKSVTLEAVFIFSDFKTAFAFMTQVAEVAERLHQSAIKKNFLRFLCIINKS
tara:strand:+ start:7449 stop:7736 length:288 start_codon:yes stop_codon:yes gene_type:complete